MGCFCPEGSAHPTLCPEGTYNDFTGGAGVKDCLECPAGHMCEDPVSRPVVCPIGQYNDKAKSKECFDCPAGSFCPYDGVITPEICPSNSYCPSGSTEFIICPDDTFNNWTGAKDISECV